MKFIKYDSGILTFPMLSDTLNLSVGHLTDLAEKRGDIMREKVLEEWLNRKLKRRFGNRVRARVKGRIIQVYGTLSCWEDIIAACQMCVVKEHGMHVVNDIRLKGRQMPRMRVPSLKDDSLEGRPKMSNIVRMAFKAAGMEETANLQFQKSHCNWIRQKEPEIWEKTDKFLLLSGYLVYCLTGQTADAAASMVGHIPYDSKTRNWQKQGALTRPVFPVEEEKLCRIVESGEIFGVITEKASADSGLPEGLPVIAAGSDKACEVMGMGCIDKETAAIGLGTTATITFNIGQYLEPERFIPPYDSIMPGYFNPEFEIFRGYWMISWFKKEFAEKEVVQAAREGCSAEELLNRRLEEIPAGCDGLLFQPYFTPNITMPTARGAVIGFSDRHTRIHIYRAIIEGINFALMDGMRLMEHRSGHKFREIRLGGGASQSDQICQITADMFGIPTVRTQTHEVAGAGCALTAFVGLGVFKDYREAVEAMVRKQDVFEPDLKQHVIYERL